MYLEAEAYDLVLGGFVIIALCTLSMLVYLFWRSRHRAILWFGGQLITLSGAFWFFFEALCFKPVPGFVMYTEEQTMNIACAGLLWALSMIRMLCGIYRLLKKGPVIHQF